MSDQYDRVSDIQAIRACTKPEEVTVGNYLVYPVVVQLVRVLRRLPVTPNAITVLAFLVATAAGGLLALGFRWAAVLIYLHYILDCTDGVLARHTGKTSRLGAMLDQTIDRYSPFVIALGMALGSRSLLTLVAALAYSWSEAASSFAVLAHRLDKRVILTTTSLRLGKAVLEGDMRFLVMALAVLFKMELVVFVVYAVLFQVSIVGRFIYALRGRPTSEGDHPGRRQGKPAEGPAGGQTQGSVAVR